MTESRRLARAQAADLVFLGDTLLVIHECDKGRGVTAARVTRELMSDPDIIEAAVRKLRRRGYLVRVGDSARHRLTLLGRTWLGE